MKKKILAAILASAIAAGAQTPLPISPVPQPGTVSQATAAQVPAAPKPVPMGSLNLDNVSLTAVVDQLARQLKMNIIVDPAVKGSITINTYGDVANLDARNLLDLILRINNCGLVKDGEFYRVIPLKSITHMPLKPEINQKNIPDDEQTILNLVFLKYVAVDELVKVLGEFKGENSEMISYAPANMLFLLDSRRNMRRTMDLIAQFDSDAFANQRVRLFGVENVKPSDVVKDLENIFKSISLDAKTSPVRFLPVDRINTLIAVAPNPGVFDNVADWLKKLDVPVKITAGAIDNYVYRVYYGRADCLAMALNQLFNPGAVVGFGASGYGVGAGNTTGTYGANGYGTGGGGGGYGATSSAYGGTSGYSNPGGYGNQNSFNSGFGGSGGCQANGMGGSGGGYGGGYNNSQAYGYPSFGGYSAQTGTPAANATGLPIGSAAASATPAAAAIPKEIPPRIIANPLDNKLIIQANAQQYQNILKILKDLDVPPRQILLEAKIYSVTLSDAFTASLTATLAQKGTSGLSPLQLLGSSTTSLGLSVGTLVGQSRELLLALSASENRTYSKLLSEPSLIATDSIPATINVGTQIPVSTGTTTIPSGGSVVTSSSVSSENTGITLQVNARINSSGVVTLIINQENSSVNAAASNSSGTAFSQQVVQTQVTMMDGDTIAIGGLIDEQTSKTSTGIPGLVDIPWIGWLFGSKSITKERDELIMFFTPHVIFDETQLVEASDELKSQVKILKRDVRRY